MIGGKRTEAKQVQKKDFDAAVAALMTRLDQKLADALTDPTIARPGVTVYPQTGTVTGARPDQVAGDVVGAKADSFTLTVSAIGRVLGVDRSVVAQLAVDRLKSGVPAGSRLIEGTIAADTGDPAVEGGMLRYSVAARAQQWRPVEPATIVAAVRGKSLQEARATLEQYGTAVVKHWPEFLDSMPTQDFRITVAVREPTAP
jgi:hypothetical protein